MRYPRVLIDLSGTLHIDDVATRNAISALQKLRDSGRSLRFVTNTTKESGEHLFQRLVRLGFVVHAKEIFSSLAAARRLVEREKLRPLYFLSESAMEDFRFAPLRPDCVHADREVDIDHYNAVLIGLAPDLFHYEQLTKAMRVLQKAESNKLVAIHKARYFARKDGLALGPGAVVAGLEYSTGKTAVVVGKPTREFWIEAIRDIVREEELHDPPDPPREVDDEEGPRGTTRRSVVVNAAGARSFSTCSSVVERVADEELLRGTIMIGDDVWDDVEAPLKLGMGAILVKTGKYRAGDEDKLACGGGGPPVVVCEDFAAAVDKLCEIDPSC